MLTNDNCKALREATLCAAESIAVALDRKLRTMAEDGDYEDTDPMFVVTRVFLSSVYGSTDLKISVHGPYDTATKAERAAQRLEGRTFIHGPVPVCQYREKL